MTEDQQVRRLMSLIKDSVPLSIASAKAGMSEPTARKYRKAGQLPSQLKKKHDWRTRADPFREVWPEVQVLLERDDGLEAKTVFQEIERRYPNRFSSGQLRTLQRRLRDWRALHGPEQEVFFPQQYLPGEQSQSDFTEMNSVEVTIAGEPLRHLIYHFVLPYSNWEQVAIAYSENFEALSEGLQGALWKLGAVPRVHRTDNLSAATHELIRTQGRGFTERYLELLSHYGMKPSKNHPGNGHENGDVNSRTIGFGGRSTSACACGAAETLPRLETTGSFWQSWRKNATTVGRSGSGKSCSRCGRCRPGVWRRSANKWSVSRAPASCVF
jgi:hypothetical protein